MPDMSRFNCVDCGVNTAEKVSGKMNNYYMTTKEVWDFATNSNRKVMLCIPCLEKRLGRKLSGSDLHICEVNLIMNDYTRPLLLEHLKLKPIV